MISPNQILNTKLQPPQLPNDLILRKELIKHANDCIERPLTLVSAGGGFGKSTFVSSWLNNIPYKNGWFSIDEKDNDLRTFLNYFVAAIHKGIPDFGKRIIPLISIPQLPPINIIISNLVNDLNELPELFVLVLDDLHFIHNKAIFQLLNSLLKFPPIFFHLVIVTRIDPPLPLTQLRSKNRMKDIRATHLKITNDEIKTFVKFWIKNRDIDNIVKILENKLDGWITGLRLAMMHLSYNQKDEKKLEKSLNEVNFSQNYFFEEVFIHLDNISKDFLLKTSILDKFSSSLADYIMESSGNKIDSKKIINKLVERNLFIINLDQEGIWFRYHHMLQSILRRELKKGYSDKIISDLHKRAMEWYEANSLFEEGFNHALQTKNKKIVVAFIERHINKPLNEDKWYILDKWLKSVPDELIHKNVTLLIAKMWILHHKNRFWVIKDLLEKVEKLNKTKKVKNEIKTQIQFFKAILLFWDTQIDESYQLFKCVRNNLNPNNVGEKGISEIYFALAGYMNGKGKEIVKEFEKILSNSGLFFSYKHLLLGGLIYIKLLEGALFVADDYCDITEKSALFYNDIFVLSWLHHFRGFINYQQNNFEKAKHYFEKAISKVYILTMDAPIISYAGLLLTLRTLNEKEYFNETYNQMVEFVHELNNPLIKAQSYSLRARLALLDNDLQSAEKYMSMTDMFFDSGNVLYGIEIPRLTQIRLLLAKEEINEAISKLNDLLSIFEKTGNNSQLIPTFILLAIAYKKKGNAKKAAELLTQALLKGSQGRWVAPFAENGAEIYELLTKLNTNKIKKDYVTQILQSISTPSKYKPLPHNLDKLTNRELDIITLLAERLSNKEIANKLYISESTVKRHAINIYQKLQVNSRRSAVAKARELGIIT